jgi:hypothetical protein
MTRTYQKKRTESQKIKNREEVMTRLLSKPLVATALLSGPASADTLTIGYWDSALGGGVTPLASSAGTEILLQKQLLAPGLVSAISSRC